MCILDRLPWQGRNLKYAKSHLDLFQIKHALFKKMKNKYMQYVYKNKGAPIEMLMQAGAATADSSLLQIFEEEDLRSTTCSLVLVSLMYCIKLHVA